MNQKNITIAAVLIVVGVGVAFLSLRGEDRPVAENPVAVQVASWDTEKIKLDRIETAKWVEYAESRGSGDPRLMKNATDKLAVLDAELVERGIEDPASLSYADLDEYRLSELTEVEVGDDARTPR